LACNTAAPVDCGQAPGGYGGNATEPDAASAREGRRLDLDRPGERIDSHGTARQREYEQRVSTFIALVSKKKVKTTARMVPPNRIGRMTSGTIPSAAISHARWVMRSSSGRRGSRQVQKKIARAPLSAPIGLH
jgi:hypothetical protein